MSTETYDRGRSVGAALIMKILCILKVVFHYSMATRIVNIVHINI